MSFTEERSVTHVTAISGRKWTGRLSAATDHRGHSMARTYVDAPLGQQVFDLPEPQRVIHIHHHSQTDRRG